MMRTEHDAVLDDLDALIAGDADAIERHADHLASCDDCRDARHEATFLAERLRDAGSDYTPADDLSARVLARLDPLPAPAVFAAAPAPEVPTATPRSAPPVAQPAPSAARTSSSAARTVVRPPLTARRRRLARGWLALGGAAAVAAGGAGIVMLRHAGSSAPSQAAFSPGDPIGHVTTIARAAADGQAGVEIEDHGAWRPIAKAAQLPPGARLRTDERTRAWLDLGDGSQLVLDHATTLAFDPREPRHVRITGGRLLADVAHIAGRPAIVATPSGEVDVVGTRFVVTATEATTAVEVVRGHVVLQTTSGIHDDVHAGEEGTIENGKLAVSPVPSLAREVEWAETQETIKPDETTAGIGALRAYKPGESRDRDWNLALAHHDVKVRIVGPIARTEITETFRNDSTQELEGRYQFPLPADAQIDALALDSNGGFVDGAFVDKQRGAKIWKGVIDKATPHHQEIARDEIIWVDGSWRDPALLDWKRGGRFELRVFPIPAKGQRTIKLAYTQVVAPRGAWRQYVYPLPHSKDGSTVADQMTVDVEVRGAAQGAVRAAGYDLQPDPARADVNALSLTQAGFVPRGDLVIAYRATDGAAELRAWTYAGGAAVAPDEKLAQKKDVGIDPKVIDEQRLLAADARPTAVLALRPALPRWKDTRPRDIMIVIDASQSMVGERFSRAGELAATLVAQMDRRDRFSVMTCDTECRRMGDLRSPSATATKDVQTWLATQTAAGATDLVASIRAAREELGAPDRERWVLYVGDGFASTGFRHVADVERAIAGAAAPAGHDVHVTTIGIGGDADSALLQAAARGGGGSYLAWTPGERVGTAASAALESTYGSALRDVAVELPAGLADVAPTTLPTLRGGEEALIAARMTGPVQGDVVVRGTLAGQPFEQRYPIHLAASASSGNAFVPRLWASLAIDQRERAGADRTKIVALSQAYGVMSRETSLLVLESQAMFDAFGVDRHVPDAKWTGEQALEEVAANGTIATAGNADLSRDGDALAGEGRASMKGGKKAEADDAKLRNKLDGDFVSHSSNLGAGGGAGRIGGMSPVPAAAQPAPVAAPPRPPVHQRAIADKVAAAGVVATTTANPFGPGAFQMRRTWVRVPAVAPYDAVSPSIVAAIGNAERSLARSPDSREAHRALVQALSYAGELDRARDLANKWLDRDRLDPQALGYQADLLGRGGQRELALRTLAGLVDLDADRVELHERMVHAYEQAGRLAQACSHRIALAALAPKDAKTAGAAIRCLRTTGKTGDADLVAGALPDDASRAAAEKAATVDPVAPKLAGDLVVAAHWDQAVDLDLSLITPDATRVSWMGGRADAVATDAVSPQREQLAVRSLKRGNYLLEVSRGDGATGTVHGTLDITVLGTKKSLPFVLTGGHVVVGRVGVTLQEQYEQVDVSGGRMTMGAVPDETLRRVMMAREPSVRACYVGSQAQLEGNAGKVVLGVTVGQYGSVTLQTRATAGFGEIAECVKQQLASMHTSPQHLSFQVTFVFQP